MVKKLRSELKAGTVFSLHNKLDHKCIALENDCPWIIKKLRRQLMHVYTPSGSVSWMEDQEVYVHSDL